MRCYSCNNLIEGKIISWIENGKYRGSFCSIRHREIYKLYMEGNIDEMQKMLGRRRKKGFRLVYEPIKMRGMRRRV